MLPINNLILIGSTMALLLAVTGFVLSQRDNWRIILLLAMLFGGMNIGLFIWSEILVGWDSFRIFLLWLTAFLPPLFGLALGAILGYVVTWRLSFIKSKGNK